MATVMMMMTRMMCTHPDAGEAEVLPHAAAEAATAVSRSGIGARVRAGEIVL